MFYKFVAIVLVIHCTNAFDLGKMTLNGGQKDDIELKNDHGKVLTTSFLNARISKAEKSTGSSAKVTFTRDTTAQHNYAMVHEVENDAKISHYSLEWSNPLPTEEFCLHIDGEQHWYSAYEEFWQKWPMDKNSNMKPEPLNSMSKIENIFLGSEGFGIYIEKNSPTFFRRNHNNGKPLLCFSGDYNKHPYNHAIDKKETKITLHLLSGTDILHVWRYIANQWIPKQKGTPDQKMIKFPIWSTWAKFHSNIDQVKVLNYAKEISSHGFPNCQLEIDDKWETHYGDFTFDPKKFPNPKHMTDTLKSQGYRTTLWVYPFVNTDSAAFKENSKHFIKTQNGQVAINNWWDGHGGVVDFTNKETQNWFVSRVEHIRNTTGIDSFKFDAGELQYLNQDFQFSDKSIQAQPSFWTRDYAETVSRLGNMIETRVAFSGQHLPIFVRMMDKNSVWSYGNGIRTLIPAALTMSIAGYPFVLPDMIGGNAYGKEFPSKELYIRWAQANALMPTLQFSITPWDFKESSNEVINATKAMLKLHEEYTPLIISLAENAVKTGEPIMRPLWWVAPTDPNTFTIDDQFMLGNDLIVAPVVTENTTKRNIYLPSGEWVDHRKDTHKGPQTLKNFKVELHELAYFTRKQ